LNQKTQLLKQPFKKRLNQKTQPLEVGSNEVGSNEVGSNEVGSNKVE
jgi:hypothetical protein